MSSTPVHSSPPTHPTSHPTPHPHIPSHSLILTHPPSPPLLAHPPTLTLPHPHLPAHPHSHTLTHLPHPPLSAHPPSPSHTSPPLPAHPSLTQEGKALLLWWKTLQLLQRQVRYVGKVVAIVPHITELAQTLCRFGEDKATDGLLGAIGLGKKSVYSLQ